MKKLLRKLFLYLFKEDFQRMKALERDLEGLIHRQKCATSLAEVRAERIRKLLGNIDVSVDVHHHSGSWAVVSLQGCLLYPSPSPRDVEEYRMPSSA